VRPLGLEARAGVGIRLAPVEPVAVAVAGADVDDAIGVIAVVAWREEVVEGATRSFDLDLDAPRVGRPDPEAGAVAGEDAGAEVETPGFGDGGWGIALYSGAP
jgi:hypothetical protein